MNKIYAEELFLPAQNEWIPEIERFDLNRWQRFKASRTGMIGIWFFVPLIFFTTFGPSLSGYLYDQTHLSFQNSPPSWQFWFGTDDLGRDIFTRCWYGARLSLFVGCVAALVDLLIGLLWGGTAGLMGGKTDELMMRLADILYSLPYLLVVILFIVFFGSGLFSIILAITITGWMTMARIVRGHILVLREMEYVMASRALGAGFWHILLKHLIPNSSGPIFITLTMSIPSAIFSESFLSFLGLGVQAPLASWGTMASEGLPALLYYPWRLFFPAFLISFTLFAFHLVGEGLKKTLTKSSHLGQL